MAHQSLGEYEYAIQDFVRVIELNPEKANAYYHKGLAQAELGNTAQAVESLLTYLALEQDSGKRVQIEKLIGELQIQ